MNNTFFSIVIPVYNTSKEYLEDCFGSVERQTYKNYEVVVVDDGSNIETKNILKTYQDKYNIVYHQKNTGIIVSRETGINNAKGDYVLYLDSDDMLDFPEPEVFDTEDQALAFCEGLGYGSDERAMPDRYPLRSCEPADAPFIEAIENYWLCRSPIRPQNISGNKTILLPVLFQPPKMADLTASLART